MKPQKKVTSAALFVRTEEVIQNATSLLTGTDATTQRLTVSGKRLTTIPVLKLNFADPSAKATLVNHASHASHSSHASHHSRHR